MLYSFLFHIILISIQQTNAVCFNFFFFLILKSPFNCAVCWIFIYVRINYFDMTLKKYKSCMQGAHQTFFLIYICCCRFKLIFKEMYNNVTQCWRTKKNQCTGCRSHKITTMFGDINQRQRTFIFVQFFFERVDWGVWRYAKLKREL